MPHTAFFCARQMSQAKSCLHDFIWRMPANEKAELSSGCSEAASAKNKSARQMSQAKSCLHDFIRRMPANEKGACYEIYYGFGADEKN